MAEPNRTNAGGLLVDRAAPIRFTFDGRRYSGLSGDTLASALLANGVGVVSRSFKYRRPRGVFAAGSEEPNAIVTVGQGPFTTPNLKATEVLLHDGLVATSQRGWPSARRDLTAAIGWLSPFLPPGFYYKTFMRPRRGWHLYEKVLRRAAASARPAPDPDPDRYERRRLHCDVLVVGAGPAGIAAAAAARQAGADVLVVDEGTAFGGSLLDTDVSIDDMSGVEWAEQVAATMGGQLLLRTTVFGRYGHGRFGAIQRQDGGARYWHIQADTAVLATGAIERPLVFPDNDRPGVMLAGSARRYARRFGVLPGARAVMVTNNDTAYGTARDLAEHGLEILAIADTREHPQGGAVPAAELLTGARGISVKGRRSVTGVGVDSGSGRSSFGCDTVLVSGGWTPAVHLHSSGGDALVHDSIWGAPVPEPGDGPAVTAGAAAGIQGLQAIIDQAHTAGHTAAATAGHTAPATDPPAVEAHVEERVDAGPPIPMPGTGMAFVDLGTDVRVHDVEVSLREGYETAEHIKRYTTLGMGPDQGKTGITNAGRIIAHLRGIDVADIPPTTYRPPFDPVTLGAIAGRESGERIAATRRSPIHQWHECNGAVFMPSGLWSRPKFYAGHGADPIEAAVHEARTVRRMVGITDVSTLGKIDLRGADVAEFLERIYVNRWRGLKIGRARYGVMLRDDGYVLDDGTTSRLADEHYLMTTTTGGAATVLEHLEFYHQRVWGHLDVTMTSVTDQWAQVAVAGPNSRDLLARLLPNDDVTDDGLPFMGFMETHLDGAPVRVARISFSGELGYEVAVPADFGLSLWERLLDLGFDLGVMPYGLEAMDYLRIEKGHLVVGADIDGRVGPHDIGLGEMCRLDKDFVGRRSLDLPVFSDPHRERLAGLVAADGATMITAGAQLVARRFDGTPQESLGRVTSRAFSPVLSKPIALGLVTGGAERHPRNVHAVSPVTGEQVEVEVVPPHFYDPEGRRMRA